MKAEEFRTGDQGLDYKKPKWGCCFRFIAEVHSRENSDYFLLKNSPEAVCLKQVEF